MAVTAVDVPGRYDVVVVTNDGTGYGFMLADEIEPNIPFRSHKALYSISPTFVQRQNISGNYGDNQQDFWLTQSQRDWSLGEQQKFFRSQGGDRQYWMGSNVDVSVPGQVTLAPQFPSLTFAAAVRTGTRDAVSFNVLVSSATNLYRVDATGTITDLGAHGLGAAPAKFGSCTDGALTYLSTTAAGTVGVRSWNNAAFATFSASAADSLAFVNNTLYGWRTSTSDLVRWDTAGTLTSLFTWKTAGGASGGSSTGIDTPVMEPFGGKLLIAFPYGQEASELWVYDGNAPQRVASFPPNFVATDMEILYGVAYIAGNFYKAASSNTWYSRPAILFYDGGQIGKLWQANAYSSTTTSNQVTGPGPALGISDGRILFTDDTTGNFMVYDPAVGGTSTIGSYTVAGTDAFIVTSNSLAVHTRNQTTGYYFPQATTYPTSGYISSSLIDFDTSLNKAMRGVTVQWDAASDGNGGSVDISYQLDSLSGAYTSLQTSAVSGTEYTFPASTKGHSVSVKVTLNKGTSTAGPALRRVNVRAAPIQLQFREREFLLHCFGVDGSADGVRLRDGTFHPKSGFAMAQDLTTIAQQTIPFTVTDKFGSFTALPNLVADSSGNGFEVYETRSAMDSDPKHPGAFVARLYVREV